MGGSDQALIQVAPHVFICYRNPPPLQHQSLPTNTTHYCQPLTPTVTTHHNKPPLMPPTTSIHHCNHPPWCKILIYPYFFCFFIEPFPYCVFFLGDTTPCQTILSTSLISMVSMTEPFHSLSKVLTTLVRDLTERLLPLMDGITMTRCSI